MKKPIILIHEGRLFTIYCQNILVIETRISDSKVVGTVLIVAYCHKPQSHSKQSNSLKKLGEWLMLCPICQSHIIVV